MSLAKSTFYYKPKAKDEENLRAEADLQDKIEEICLEWPRYGYRRVTKELKAQGLDVNHKPVARIMREKSLQAKIKRRWIKTTDSNHPHPIFSNLLKGLVVTQINQAWVSDITYIRLALEFVYLAVIMDLYSRKIIGWALSRNIDARLTLAALRMALEERQPPPGCVHHSDRGVQYAAGEYVEELQASGLIPSMAAKGNPYDNAAAESFMKTLKYDEVYLWDYRTMEDVLNRIPYFLDEIYNKKRLHSALGYRSPERFEADIQAEIELKSRTEEHTNPELLSVQC